LKELFSWVLFNRELWYFIQLEIGILTSCNNPNIVKLYEHFPSSDKYYLVYEICSDGDLKNLIEKDGKMTESATLEIVGQMALALIYLSEKQIIHRDIKPENIFIQSGVAKLGDFGLCERGTIEIRHAMVGSPAF
jgi:serine/threonine protein kinase